MKWTGAISSFVNYDAKVRDEFLGHTVSVGDGSSSDLLQCKTHKKPRGRAAVGFSLAERGWAGPAGGRATSRP